MTTPLQLVDAHHHFLDTTNNSFQSFLGSLVPDQQYLPQHYDRDVTKPLLNNGVQLVGSVHVECMPDSGYDEAVWVESLTRTCQESVVKAIVASCDLAADNAETVNAKLAQLKKACPNKLRGVRWILDCVGPYEPNTATHVGTKRHDGVDYLRGCNNGVVVPAFERGFALLGKHNLSFDLQCAPAQLLQAAALCARHPDIPVCINHMGKPRMLLGPDTPENIDNVTPNELAVWRTGMKAMAAVPHVYVKISMLGYIVPGWIRTPERTALVRQLVRETVQLFGVQRCMVALNWWKDGATSDADGLSTIGPSPVELVRHFSNFCEDYSDEDRQRLFVGTARQFYRF